MAWCACPSLRQRKHWGESAPGSAKPAGFWESLLAVPVPASCLLKFLRLLWHSFSLV